MLHKSYQRRGVLLGDEVCGCMVGGGGGGGRQTYMKASSHAARKHCSSPGTANKGQRRVKQKGMHWAQAKGQPHPPKGTERCREPSQKAALLLSEEVTSSASEKGRLTLKAATDASLTMTLASLSPAQMISMKLCTCTLKTAGAFSAISLRMSTAA